MTPAEDRPLASWGHRVSALDLFITDALDRTRRAHGALVRPIAVRLDPADLARVDALRGRYETPPPRAVLLRAFTRYALAGGEPPPVPPDAPPPDRTPGIVLYAAPGFTDRKWRRERREEWIRKGFKRVGCYASPRDLARIEAHVTSVCDREDIIDCALTIGLRALDRWFPVRMPDPLPSDGVP